MSASSALKKALKRLFKEITLHHVFPERYRRFRKKYRKKEEPDSGAVRRAVFLEEYGKELSDNCRAMARELKRRGNWRIRSVYLHREEGKGMKVFLNSFRALKSLAGADVIFLDDSSELVSCLPLEEDVKVVQLWHACGAFKKFGYSLEGKRFGADREELERFPRHRNFSLVTVSAPEVAWAYVQAFGMEDRPEAVQALGIPRTDCFYSLAKRKAAWTNLAEQLPPGKRVRMPEKPESMAAWNRAFHALPVRIVLYAPTFRGNVSGASAPALPDFGALHEQLGGDWVFLVKQHPYVKNRPEIREEWKEFVLDVTDTLPIEELLMVSHVCISDYSSLVFEYSLLERPVLFYAPDLEQYQDWRGFYYPYEEMTPGPVITGQEELGRCLGRVDAWSGRERIRDFRRKFMEACDGKAARRIADCLDAETGIMKETE